MTIDNDDNSCESESFLATDSVTTSGLETGSEEKIAREADVTNSSVGNSKLTAAETNVCDASNDSFAAPDSTINNTNELLEPPKLISLDRKNEVQNEIPDVSSTYNSDMCKETPVPKVISNTAVDSLSSLLSILQDKTKIQQLLNILDDSGGENHKIKKKLEKLCEIVVDKEDSADEAVDHKETVTSSSNLQNIKKIPVNENSTLPVCTNQKTEESLAIETINVEPLLDSDSKKYHVVNDNVKISKDDSRIENDSKVIDILGDKSIPVLKLAETDKMLLCIDSESKKSTEDINLLSNPSVDKIDNDITYSRSSTSNDIEAQEELPTIKNSASNNSQFIEAQCGNSMPNTLLIEAKSVENDDDVVQNPQETVIDDMESKLNNDDVEASKLSQATSKTKITTPKRTRYGKGKFKRQNAKKSKPASRNEITQSVKTVSKSKTSRELLQLQEDIKDLMSKDALNATGIRMCRLAKMIYDDEKSKPCQKELASLTDSNPVVVLNKDSKFDETLLTKKPTRKKPGPKPKIIAKEIPADIDEGGKSKMIKNKPGPKSKKIAQKNESKVNDVDPYHFDTDSIADSINTFNDSDVGSEVDSDSENGSRASSLKSYGSTEVLADLKKKPKRKRSAWQSGVIKTKRTKKKKNEQRLTSLHKENTIVPLKIHNIPDKVCFIDKNYCFHKNVSSYSCRHCNYTGIDIVHHYKKEHPHTEIPLSRFDPTTANQAIEESETIVFPAISNMNFKDYVCRFCKEKISVRSNLESFFWHVVSKHTGEYKQACSKCDENGDNNVCSFNLAIPSPPKHNKGLLLGYLCKKCNFTQVSVENLKTHVINRHDDEETEIYTINLAVMSKIAFQRIVRKNETKKSLVRRSTRSTRSTLEASDDGSDEIGSTSHVSEDELDHINTEDQSESAATTLPIKAKITFETNMNEHSDTERAEKEICIKEESEERNIRQDETLDDQQPVLNDNNDDQEIQVLAASSDIKEHLHFKISFSETGTKTYICCVNGEDNHYKTSLQISMKKHVQMKHTDNWDGYCAICKVIVMPQGRHHFKDCWQHYLDKHMDDFPVLETLIDDTSNPQPTSSVSSHVEQTMTPTYNINVRRIEDLISKPVESTPETPIVLPVIENVLSLLPPSPMVEAPRPSPSYPDRSSEPPVQQIRPTMRYEDWQGEIMTKKHRVVLEAMMYQAKLIQIFKCAGRFCSFTTDDAERALLHASTHQKIGGENSLDCAYCDFDSSKNAIDLVMHVFKSHGRCQYACGLCFYRAAASQLVGAHITRVHPDKQAVGHVLKNISFITPYAEDTSNLLSRSEAVSYYVCNNNINKGDDSEKCKFRTFTAGKFFEHLTERHNPPFCCKVCMAIFQSAKELLHHMKIHGYQLYQCTWCVHGADDEASMLEHSSQTHPTKQPQAYVRIVTNKDGSHDFRVLPLAYLTKNQVPAKDLTPAISKDDPAREAERSIELEKLIGHIETASTLVAADDPQTIEPPPPEIVTETKIAVRSILQQNPLRVEPIEPNEQMVTEVVGSDPETAPTVSGDSGVQPTDDTNNPPIKNEPPAEGNNSYEEIYCLDTDEEEAGEFRDTTAPVVSSPIVDLSEEDARIPASEIVDDYEYTTIPITDLYKCPKCSKKVKGQGGFKKHTNSCLAKFSGKIRCPHKDCPKKVTSIEQLCMHYNNDHRDSKSHIYTCSICDTLSYTFTAARKHMKDTHDIIKFSFTAKQNKDGKYIHYMKKTTQKKTAVDKLYFGPQDIDNIPINPILNQSMQCSECLYNTKVRLNMVRHLQMHAKQQPVPETAPVNPVPYLETNERHFDKMINLASSSVNTRLTDKPAREPVASSSSVIPLEAVSRYPKYVPERQRHACGARECSYISLDEGMLKRHWDTLHSGSNDFHCVHCPSSQQLDTSQPLTSGRIIAHLRMHDSTLYACSICPYYHYVKGLVEKHLTDFHKGGRVMVVREEGVGLPTSPAPSTAPTMDLKPWQCGVCEFKSMLRPEVVEHCSKFHQSKMQFKCSYCPYRASAIENIKKHQSNTHAGKPEDVFFFYYREGSVPNEPDGTPKWQYQRQKVNATELPVKLEVDPPTAVAARNPTTSSVVTPVTAVTPTSVTAVTSNIPSVNLSIVKKETIDQLISNDELSMLCKKYGEISEPNGIRYLCSLCKVIMADSKDVMESHLYEELQYRKWGCGFCSYKAFHLQGLNGHMVSEHRRQSQNVIELPKNDQIEKWVSHHLDFQCKLIEKRKENLIQQKVVTPAKATVSSPRPPELTPEKTQPKSNNYKDCELILAFGEFGEPDKDMFSCPKCEYKVKEEAFMREHLEQELNKIRWNCNKCTKYFHTYHEAQFHCRMPHLGCDGPPHPKEAVRDPAMRAAWLENTITKQKKKIKDTKQTCSPDKMCDIMDPSDNSLLVVRYEEDVPDPESTSRKRLYANDSDDERLVIDEPVTKKTNHNEAQCKYCDFVPKYASQAKAHLLRHYDLKPYLCGYCPFTGYYKTLHKHLANEHNGLPTLTKSTPVPNYPPKSAQTNIVSTKNVNKDKQTEEPTKICLQCEITVPESRLQYHIHDNKVAEFASKGEIVIKCCICLSLVIDMESLKNHHNVSHPESSINYAYFKVHYDTRGIIECSYCKQKFSFIRDLRTHHNALHATVPLKYVSTSYSSERSYNLDEAKRKSMDASNMPPAKRIAKKSTTKLPRVNTVAKKSTTKLPSYVSDMESAGEYSYYGTKPGLEKYENVKTLVPVLNTIMSVDLTKFGEMLPLQPQVILKDINK